MIRVNRRLPPAVVLGLSPTGLHVVRTLAQSGVAVTGVSAELQAGCFSRHLVDRIIEPDEGRRLERLCARFSAPGSPGPLRPALIPTSDQDIDFIIAHADRLERHFVFQESYRDGMAERIMTKESFYELCESEG